MSKSDADFIYRLRCLAKARYERRLKELEDALATIERLTEPLETKEDEVEAK